MVLQVRHMAFPRWGPYRGGGGGWGGVAENAERAPIIALKGP